MCCCLFVEQDEVPQQAALAAAGITLSSGSSSGTAGERIDNIGPLSAVQQNDESIAAVLQRLTLGANATETQPAATKRPDDADTGTAGSSSRVSQVLAAMGGRLLPPAAVVEQAGVLMQQLLDEATAVQQQLAQLEAVTWPALLEAGIHEAWSGHPTGATPVRL